MNNTRMQFVPNLRSAKIFTVKLGQTRIMLYTHQRI